jgi:small subunit ribosomal protein S4
MNHRTPKKLFGTINPIQGQPNFVIPVFAEDQIKYIQIVDPNEVVIDFKEIDCIDTIIVRCNFLLESRIGGNAKRCFDFGGENIFFGEKVELSDKLSKCLDMFKDKPFLLIEISDFIGDNRLRIKCIESANDLLRMETGSDSTKWSIATLKPNNESTKVLGENFLLIDYIKENIFQPFYHNAPGNMGALMAKKMGQKVGRPEQVYGKVQRSYGKQLKKQKIRRIHGILENQFRKYFERTDRMQGVTNDTLMLILERRLDNFVFRQGFAASRVEAQKLVLDGWVTVNGRKVNSPDILVKAHDVVQLRRKNGTIAYSRDVSGTGEYRNVYCSAERDMNAAINIKKTALEAENNALSIHRNLICDLKTK